MKITIAIFTLVFFGFTTAYAQDDDDMSWRQKLKMADQLMEEGSYYNAIELYKEVVEEKPNDGEISFNLANALYLGRDYIEAEKYYKKAYETDKEKYADAYYYYGLMLKMNGKYQQALDVYNEFYRNRDADRDLRRVARYEINSVEDAIIAFKAFDSTNIVITHLSTNVNDVYTEFSPILKDKDELIYASLEVDSIPVLEKRSDKIPRAKFYRSIKVGDEWGEGKELDGPFNDKKEHAGNGSFSPDGKRFYFTRCEDGDGASVLCDIYLSELKDGEWTKPKKLGFNEKDANDTHPTLAPYRRGEEILIFSSNREGGQGGMDLYYAYQDRRGDWRVRDMRRFNTEGHEVTPFYDWETDILYFSSNMSARKQINYGGFDIYASKRRSTTGTSFAYPQNLGLPFNSSVDDMYYWHHEGSDKGFFVSNRKEALSPKWQHCCDDIFEFEKIYPPKFTIMAKVYEVENQNEPHKENPVDSANIELYRVDQGAQIDSAVSDADSLSEFYLGTLHANFRLRALKPGHLSGENTTSTVGLKESDTLYVDLYIEPITTKSITLRNVYFDLDKCFIREDAKPSLDTVYNLLVKNPHIRIELSSHTDSRAADQYNMDLSQCRADSSKAYLEQRGIDPDRIVAKGYGETQLLNECDDGVPCTEIEHQLNRRTEFRIIGEIPGTIVTYDKSEIERVKERKKQGSGSEQINWDFREDDEEEPEEDTP